MSDSGSESSIFKKAAELQSRMAGEVIACDTEQFKPETFCGFDASYSNGMAYCSAVVIKNHEAYGGDSFRILETIDNQVPTPAPYVPGVFMLREGPLAIKTISKLNTNFDAIMIDGHGLLHPRRCGLACFVGLSLDRPAVGVAKSLLCGRERADHFVEYKGEVRGYALEAQGKKLFVSVGHKMSLSTAVLLVEKFIKPGQRSPEPLRVADERSKQALKLSRINKNKGLGMPETRPSR